MPSGLSYLGTPPTNKALNENNYVFHVVGTVSTFSAVYTPGYVDVYKNGARLDPTVDFTATNGTSVVLTVAATDTQTILISGRTSSTPYDYYTKAQVEAITGRYYGVVGSAVNPDAMAVNTTPAMTSLVDGMEIRLRVPGANTIASPTVTFSQIGVIKSIGKIEGRVLVAGDYITGQEIILRYNSAVDKMILLNPFTNNSGVIGSAASLSAANVVQYASVGPNVLPVADGHNLTGITAATATALTTATGTAPSYSARAYAHIDGTRDNTGASSTANGARYIVSAGNISSVVYTASDTPDSVYTSYFGPAGPANTPSLLVTFTTPMPTATYSVVPHLSYANLGNINGTVQNISTTQFKIWALGAASITLFKRVNFVVFG